VNLTPSAIVSSNQLRSVVGLSTSSFCKRPATERAFPIVDGTTTASGVAPASYRRAIPDLRRANASFPEGLRRRSMVAPFSAACWTFTLEERRWKHRERSKP
jgi:hypothetical protein